MILSFARRQPFIRLLVHPCAASLSSSFAAARFTSHCNLLTLYALIENDESILKSFSGMKPALLTYPIPTQQYCNN